MNNVTKSLPAKLKLLSYCWIGFPLGFLAFSAVVFQVSLSGLAKIMLSPGYWFLSCVALWTGFSMINVRWYAWHVFLFANLLLTYQCAVVLLYFSDAQFKFALFVASIALQIIALFLVRREIRVPYYSPSIRWWESDPRYKLSLKTVLKRIPTKGVMPTEQGEDADIVDLSRGGCFIKTNLHYDMDMQIQLNFSLFEKPITCFGQVVWSTASTITHPKGVGVRFINLDKQTSIILKEASNKFKEMAQTYNEITKEKNWQDYVEREKQFQSHRNKGNQ